MPYFVITSNKGKNVRQQACEKITELSSYKIS